MRSRHLLPRRRQLSATPGVTWRLARQLAHEHGAAVTLRIDAPRRARAHRAGDRSPRDRPGRAGVRCSVSTTPRTSRWPTCRPSSSKASAAGLPARYLDAMARGGTPTGVDQPRIPVGRAVDRGCAWAAVAASAAAARSAISVSRASRARTGGLLRERDLLAPRDAFAPSRDAERLLAPIGRSRPRRRRRSRRVAVLLRQCARCRALLDAWAEATSRCCASCPRAWRPRRSIAWLGRGAAGGADLRRAAG